MQRGQDSLAPLLVPLITEPCPTPIERQLPPAADRDTRETGSMGLDRQGYGATALLGAAVITAQFVVRLPALTPLHARAAVSDCAALPRRSYSTR